MTNDDLRTKVLRAFAVLLGLPELKGLTQRGRDPETARFTLTLADGRSVRIGTIKVLRSQTELAGVLAVAVDCCPPAIERKDWHDAIAALLTHAKDVDETPGETFEAAVAEWTLRYADRATTDKDGAAPRGEPIRDGQTLYVTANGLARYIRREYSEQIKLHALRQAIVDLGGERCNVSYTKPGGSRSSTSYYRIAVGDLDQA